MRDMRIGAVYPQTELPPDPGSVRAWAVAVEELGFAHALAFDHVLGAGLSTRPDWTGPYHSETPFHEVFVLFGFLAAAAPALELVSGIVILPQRQTALVAKQAASLDVLTGGKLRLGVGLGWNKVEFDALGEEFGNRGRRAEEQVDVLRTLWTDTAVSYSGQWHQIDNAGLNPLPVRRRIPVWFGGSVDATLRRVARIGDGWLPQRWPDEKAAGQVEMLRQYVAEAGRSMDDVGIEPRLTVFQKTPDQWPDYLTSWAALGATHLTVNTMGAGYTSLDQHVETLRAVLATAREVGVVS
jgi:probable F420-dependent oxidoreductase